MRRNAGWIEALEVKLRRTVTIAAGLGESLMCSVRRRAVGACDVVCMHALWYRFDDTMERRGIQ